MAFLIRMVADSVSGLAWMCRVSPFGLAMICALVGLVTFRRRDLAAA